MFRLWKYHWSNKQTVKCICIMLYNNTVHCTIRTTTKSVKRQHKKGPQRKVKWWPEICEFHLPQPKPTALILRFGGGHHYHLKHYSLYYYSPDNTFLYWPTEKNHWLSPYPRYWPQILRMSLINHKLKLELV